MKAIKELSLEVYDFLKNNDLNSLPVGIINLDNGCYVSVQEYTTKANDTKEYEAHKKYIDLQYLISGEEIIEIVPISALTISREYDEVNDYTLFENDQRGEGHHLKAGDYLICHPEDGHMPGLKVKEEVQVKKAVFKIPVKR